jgi:hypothetical protein
VKTNAGFAAKICEITREKNGNQALSGVSSSMDCEKTMKVLGPAEVCLSCATSEDTEEI